MGTFYENLNFFFKKKFHKTVKEKESISPTEKKMITEDSHQQGWKKKSLGANRWFITMYPTSLWLLQNMAPNYLTLGIH